MNKLLIVTIVGVTKFRPAVMRKGLEIFGIRPWCRSWYGTVILAG